MQKKLFSDVYNFVKTQSEMFSVQACFAEHADYRRPIPSEYLAISPFLFDRDQILNSAGFARYADKSQVVSFSQNNHITRRMLHVQLVAAIAREICRRLNLNEDLAEAMALGHDLGHSPYTHEGEVMLSTLAEESLGEYFVHNAQSMRYLLSLSQFGKGYNISLQVLDGILAHNGECLLEAYQPKRGKDWDQLLDEYQHCFTDKKYDKKIIPTTLEGCVVRISDIIAYVGRDIFDAMLLGAISFEEMPATARNVLGCDKQTITRRLINDLVEQSMGKDYIAFSAKVHKALDALLFEFNYKRIYLNPQIKSQIPKMQNMMRNLFNLYLEDLEIENRNSGVFKNHLDNLGISYAQETKPPRIVIDFMAGMTDSFMLNQYKLRGFPKKDWPVEIGYQLGG